MRNALVSAFSSGSHWIMKAFMASTLAAHLLFGPTPLCHVNLLTVVKADDEPIFTLQMMLDSYYSDLDNIDFYAQLDGYYEAYIPELQQEVDDAQLMYDCLLAEASDPPTQEEQVALLAALGALNDAKALLTRANQLYCLAIDQYDYYVADAQAWKQLIADLYGVYL